ncbi:MAG: universal stress protein [Candidatus Obscuribacterales bacterium]|nr:universal stress protein [Candidatus Obscuribacterales bacterium]
MKVIVAIDDSPYSKHVVDTVVRRHWLPDTQFKVLTVIESLYIGDEDDVLKEQLINLRARRHEHMTELCAQIRDRLEEHIPTAKAHFEVREGDPKVEIIEAAIDWSADQILVGAHGRNICPHFLLGSVSRTIAAHAPCSVEIVRAKTGAGTKSCKSSHEHSSKVRK